MADKIIYQTKYWKIILHPNQYYLGRCVVILKRKCGDLAKLKQEELIDFLEVVKKLENTMRRAFNATMFNWTCLMNNTYRVKNPKPQVHWHFRARYNSKVRFEGEIFEDKEFGEHYVRTNRKISEDIENKIVKKIKENIR